MRYGSSMGPDGTFHPLIIPSGILKGAADQIRAQQPSTNLLAPAPFGEQLLMLVKNPIFIVGAVGLAWLLTRK